MDMYGISNAITGGLHIYFQTSRGSGRTASLVESVKDGDCICFMDHKEASRVERLCQERGINITYMVVDPRNISDAFKRGPSKGRFIFDHSWVEVYYLHHNENLRRELDAVAQQLSSDKEPRKKTRRQNLENSKWSEFK